MYFLQCFVKCSEIGLTFGELCAIILLTKPCVSGVCKKVGGAIEGRLVLM